MDRVHNGIGADSRMDGAFAHLANKLWDVERQPDDPSSWEELHRATRRLWAAAVTPTRLPSFADDTLMRSAIRSMIALAGEGETSSRLEPSATPQTAERVHRAFADAVLTYRSRVMEFRLNHVGSGPVAAGEV